MLGRFRVLTIDLILLNLVGFLGLRCLIFVSCWTASSGLNERIHIQKLAGISGGVCTILCNPYLSDKMDTSIFPDSLPIKLPQAPTRNISYRSSLRSLKTVGNTIPQVGQGSTFKHYRPKRQMRTRIGTAESQLPGDQSP